MTTEEKAQYIVRQTDYLANPAILIKNYIVLSSYISRVAHMEQDEGLLTEAQTKINQLKKECYHFRNHKIIRLDATTSEFIRTEIEELGDKLFEVK